MTLSIYNKNTDRAEGRDDHQTFLNYYMPSLATFHHSHLLNSGRVLPQELGGVAPQGYNRLKCIAGGSHPSALLQKLVSFTGIYDFLNLAPHHMAQLVPKIRIYRELGVSYDEYFDERDNINYDPTRPNDWLRARGKLHFSNYTDDIALSAITNRVEALGGEVGIKEFSFEDYTKGPGLPTQIFSCKLKLYAKSLQALAKTQYQLIFDGQNYWGGSGEEEYEGKGYLSCPISLACLLRPASDTSDVTLYFPESDNNRAGTYNARSAIKLRIGWELPPYNQLSLELGEGNSYLNTALAMMEQEFELYFQKYDISFNDDGSVEVDIDYAGNVWTQEPDYLTDVLSAGDYQTRQDVQNEQRQQASNAAEWLGSTTASNLGRGYNNLLSFVNWHRKAITEYSDEDLMDNLFGEAKGTGANSLTMGYLKFFTNYTKVGLTSDMTNMILGSGGRQAGLYAEAAAAQGQYGEGSPDSGAGFDVAYAPYEAAYGQQEAKSAENLSTLSYPGQGSKLSPDEQRDRIRTDGFRLNSRLLYPLLKYWCQNERFGLKSAWWTDNHFGPGTTTGNHTEVGELVYSIMTAPGQPSPSDYEALGITKPLALDIQQLLLQIADNPGDEFTRILYYAADLAGRFHNTYIRDTRSVMPKYGDGNKMLDSAAIIFRDRIGATQFIDFLAYAATVMPESSFTVESSEGGTPTTGLHNSAESGLTGYTTSKVDSTSRTMAGSRISQDFIRSVEEIFQAISTDWIGESAVTQRVSSQHVDLVDSVYSELFEELNNKNRIYVLPISLGHFKSTNLSDKDLLSRIRLPSEATSSELQNSADTAEQSVAEAFEEDIYGQEQLTESEQAEAAQVAFEVAFFSWLTTKSGEWEGEQEEGTSDENYYDYIRDQYLESPETVARVFFRPDSGIFLEMLQDPELKFLFEEATSAEAYTLTGDEYYQRIDIEPIPVEEVETRIYFTYLGDILEALFQMTAEGFSGYKRTEIVLGPYYYEGFSLCIADMPISFTLLNTIWRDSIRKHETEGVLPLNTFVNYLIEAINAEIMSVKTGTGNIMSSTDILSEHHISQKNLSIPHLESEPFDSWWPRTSQGYMGRVQVGHPNFAFPVPYTSDDLAFTQISFVYGGAAPLPLSLTGDLENDLYGYGRSAIDTNNLSTGVDSYYERYGPIYHLRWGADRGIVKTIDFTTIDNSHLATYFIAQSAGYNLKNSQGGQTSVDVARAQAGQQTQNPSVELEEIENEEEWQKQQRTEEEEVKRLLAGAQNLETVQLFHKAKITAIGCSLFKNGAIIYIDPQMPGLSVAAMDSTSVTQALHIGGYYLVTKTSGISRDGQYEVEIEAHWLNLGRPEEAIP